MRPEDRIRQALKVTETGAMMQFNKDSQFAQALRDVLARQELLLWLTSEENIDHLAGDIAEACVNCHPEIRETRHAAMIRLGKRLRDPLPLDMERWEAKQIA